MFPKCLYCALQRMLLPIGTHTNKSTRKIFGLNGLRLYVVQEEHTSRCPGRSYLTLSEKIIPHVVREDHTSRCPGRSYLTLSSKNIPYVHYEKNTQFLIPVLSTCLWKSDLYHRQVNHPILSYSSWTSKHLWKSKSALMPRENITWSTNKLPHKNKKTSPNALNYYFSSSDVTIILFYKYIQSTGSHLQKSSILYSICLIQSLLNQLIIVESIWIQFCMLHKALIEWYCKIKQVKGQRL